MSGQELILLQNLRANSADIAKYEKQISDSLDKQVQAKQKVLEEEKKEKALQQEREKTQGRIKRVEDAITSVRKEQADLVRSSYEDAVKTLRNTIQQRGEQNTINKQLLDQLKNDQKLSQQEELRLKNKLSSATLTQQERDTLEQQLAITQQSNKEYTDKLRILKDEISLNKKRRSEEKIWLADYEKKQKEQEKKDKLEASIRSKYGKSAKERQADRSSRLKKYEEDKAVAKAQLNEGLITQDQYVDAVNKSAKDNNIQPSDKTLDAITNGFNKAHEILNTISSTLGGSIDSAVSDIAQYSGKINTRLYGSTGTQKSFTDILQDIQSIGVSGYVSQKSYLENISKFVEAGVNYNLENRALLYTLQDRLVTTFNALDENLLQLTRLQQADMTQSALGSESLLTSFLNSTFSDTSYLTDVYDTVYGSIVEAMSTLDTDQATQFNFYLQKWLASLYSVGFSKDALTGIATALNSLATGDISKLQGTSGQILLALTSASSGKSLANYLVEGFTSGEDVNDIMYSMVEYLQDIANNTNSKAVRSQWADILGLNNSDWTALQNLTEQDLVTISEYKATQQTATDEVQNLFNTFLDARTDSTYKYKTAIDNAMYTMGMGIASDFNSYLLYELDKVLSKADNLLDIDGELGAFGFDIGVDLGDVLGGVVELGYLSTGLKALGSSLGLEISDLSDLFATQGTYGGTTTTEGYAVYEQNNRKDSSQAASSMDDTGISLEDLLNSLSGLIQLPSAILAQMTAVTSVQQFMEDKYGFSTTTTRGGQLSSSTGVETGTSKSTMVNAGTVEVVTSTSTIEVDDEVYGGTFEENENAIQSGYAQVTSAVASSTATKSIDDLYDMLFVNQQTAIRVSLASLELNAQTQLASVLPQSSMSDILSGVRSI